MNLTKLSCLSYGKWTFRSLWLFPLRAMPTIRGSLSSTCVMAQHIDWTYRMETSPKGLPVRMLSVESIPDALTVGIKFSVKCL